MAQSKTYKRLWHKAIAALARREHSIKELGDKLLEACEGDQDEVEHARLMAFLVAEDYVNDERFADMLCRTRFNRGIGPLRLRSELNGHNLDSELITRAMEPYQSQWVDRLCEIRERKYGEDKPEDYKAWAKQARFLQQRGFSSDQIHLAIERAGGLDE